MSAGELGGRWSRLVQEWQPRQGKRSSVGRAMARRTVDLRKMAGSSTMRAAQQQESWRVQEEACVQQWMRVN